MFPILNREAMEQIQKTESILDRWNPSWGQDLLRELMCTQFHADWLEAGFHDTCYTLPCRAGMYITQDNNQSWTRGSLRNMLVYATWPMGINRRLVVSDAGEVQKALYPTTNVTNKHFDYDSSPMITPCDPDPRSMSVSCSHISTHMLQHYQVKNKVRKRRKFIK